MTSHITKDLQGLCGLPLVKALLAHAYAEMTKTPVVDIQKQNLHMALDYTRHAEHIVWRMINRCENCSGSGVGVHHGTCHRCKGTGLEPQTQEST